MELLRLGRTGLDIPNLLRRNLEDYKTFLK